MVESDSIRLARIETKMDSWMERNDERYVNTCRDIRCVRDEADKMNERMDSVEKSQAKMMGFAAAIGAGATLLGQFIMKILPTISGK